MIVRNRQRFQCTGLDVWQRTDGLVEHQRYPTAVQVDHRLARPLVRHMHDINLGVGTQHLARQVRGGAIAG
ncbi:hypothetical protein D3C71_1823320 [compost metagenome]